MTLSLLLAYSIHAWWSIKVISIDLDAANHLRLAQLWNLGVLPSHSYSWGIKRGLIILYSGVWKLFRRRYETHRFINYFGFALGHFALELIVTEHAELAHLALFLLNISPLSHHYTSTLDFVVFPLLLIASEWVSRSTSSFSFWSFLLLVIALAVGWKISLTIFIWLLPALFISSYILALPLIGAITLWVAGETGLLRRATSKVLRYRSTRRMARKKVLVPLIVSGSIILSWTLSLLIHDGVSEKNVPAWLVLLLLCSVSYVIATGDFLTGSSSYAVTLPGLMIMFYLSPEEVLNFVVATLAVYSLLGIFKLPGLRWQDSQRIFSQADLYPTDRSQSIREAQTIVDVVPNGRPVLFITQNALLSLYSGLPSPDGCPYNVNHSRFWGISACEPDQYVEDGNYIYVSSEIMERDLSHLSGYKHCQTERGRLIYPV